MTLHQGDVVTLADESGEWLVTRVQGTVVHVADTRSFVETCVPLTAVMAVKAPR